MVPLATTRNVVRVSHLVDLVLLTGVKQDSNIYGPKELNVELMAT